MTKRNRHPAAKPERDVDRRIVTPAHEVKTVIVTPPRPALASSPREQLRTALGELRSSTTHLFEAALSEAQHTAAAFVSELRSRATTLLASLKGAPRVARKGAAMNAQHSAVS